jgi:hypothetical protein
MTAAKSYIVWGKESPEEGYECLFATSEEDAVENACELFGYDVEYLTGIQMEPEDAVCVVRAPTLDEYCDRGSVPEQVFRDIVDAIKRTHVAETSGGKQ